MSVEKFWSASDGTRLFYRYDDFTDRLTALAMPVLMAVPDPDPMVARSEYERMRLYLPQCTFVTFPGAGHSMTAEIPDRCAEVLKSFLHGLT